MAHDIKNLYQLLDRDSDEFGLLHTTLPSDVVSELWTEACADGVDDFQVFLESYVWHHDPDATRAYTEDILPITG